MCIIGWLMYTDGESLNILFYIFNVFFQILNNLNESCLIGKNQILNQ